MTCRGRGRWTAHLAFEPGAGASALPRYLVGLAAQEAAQCASALLLAGMAPDPEPVHLSVYPGGSGQPNVSNLNYVAGQTIPNMVVVPLGPGGTVTLFNAAGTVHVIADLVGYDN